MANIPGKPVRKSTQVGTSKLGQPVPGPNRATPNRKSAQPFGGVNKSTYTRRSAGVTAGGQPINDKDSGNNSYRAPGNNPKNSTARPPYSRSGQPFNNPGVKRGSRTMKGVD